MKFGCLDFFFNFNFNREKKYELDSGSLEGIYKDWQKKLHPDLVHNKSLVSLVFYYTERAFHLVAVYLYFLQFLLNRKKEISQRTSLQR